MPLSVTHRDSRPLPLPSPTVPCQSHTSADPSAFLSNSSQNRTAALDLPSPASLTCQPGKQASQASTDEAQRPTPQTPSLPVDNWVSVLPSCHIHSLSRSEAQAFLAAWSQVASPSSWQERCVTADRRAQASSVAHSRGFSRDVTPADIRSLPPQCPWLL